MAGSPPRSKIKSRCVYAHVHTRMGATLLKDPRPERVIPHWRGFSVLCSVRSVLDEEGDEDASAVSKV